MHARHYDRTAIAAALKASRSLLLRIAATKHALGKRRGSRLRKSRTSCGAENASGGLRYRTTASSIVPVRPLLAVYRLSRQRNSSRLPQTVRTTASDRVLVSQTALRRRLFTCARSSADVVVVDSCGVGHAGEVCASLPAKLLFWVYATQGDHFRCQIRINSSNLVHDFPSHFRLMDNASILAGRCRPVPPFE